MYLINCLTVRFGLLLFNTFFPIFRVVISVFRHTIWPTDINKAQLESKQREETLESRTTSVDQSPEIERTPISI